MIEKVKTDEAVGTPFWIVHYSYIAGNAEIRVGKLGIAAETESVAKTRAMETLRADKEKKAPIITKVRPY